MIWALRVLGTLNAAVWLGAAVFFTVGAPALFTPEAKGILGEAQSGIAAMLLLQRYFALQIFCGTIALAHQFAEHFYLGRPLNRLTLGILIAVFTIALAGGLWLQPKLRQLHEVKYGYRRAAGQYVRHNPHSVEQRTQAAQAFGKWHGVSMGLNLLALAGLAVFNWRLGNPPNGPRFIPSNKFRS